MNNFKNLKIAITDETHLKAVCDVLESMDCWLNCGDGSNKLAKWVIVVKSGRYDIYNNDRASGDWAQTITLSDLLKMRDDMVKANAKSS
ncbi:MAG: hypothetical protein RSC05_04545 [Acinetobacter sp.]